MCVFYFGQHRDKNLLCLSSGARWLLWCPAMHLHPPLFLQSGARHWQAPVQILVLKAGTWRECSAGRLHTWKTAQGICAGGVWAVQGEFKGLISSPCIFCRFTSTDVAQWDVLDPPTRLWFGVRSLLVTSVSTSQNQRKWLHRIIWALKFYYLDCINQLFLSAPIKDKNPSILFKIPCFYQVCDCGFLAGKETNENI